MPLPVINSTRGHPADPPFGSTAAGPRSISAVRVLRISLTDRCNFRCIYCMPAEGVKWLPRDDILRFEEIIEIVQTAMDVHSICRFKLTGGEPTVRHGIADLVWRLRRLQGVEDLSMTTNGMLLENLAAPLKQAGLDRLTVSIDSLRPDRFRQITRTGDLDTVLRGLTIAEEVGFENLKINCVAMRGMNDEELVDFARLTLTRNLTVRFIEYMPLGNAAIMRADSRRVDQSESGPAGGCGAQDRGKGAFISEAEVRQRIEPEVGPLIEVNRSLESGVGPAAVYRLAHGNPRGRIGFISAMSAPFCSTCNRLRLTADGVLRSCLFEGGEVNVREILRSGLPPSQRRAALARAMVDCIRLNPQVHGFRGNQQMSRIGG